jgi:hypothetical protein
MQECAAGKFHFELPHIVRSPRRREQAKSPASQGRAGLAAARNPITGIAGCCARATSGQAAAALPRIVMKSRRHVAPLPGQLAQQLLRNAYDVVFTVIQAR